MNTKHLATLLGFTSIVVLNPLFPVQAASRDYIETSGIVSLQPEQNALTLLESLGLSLNSFTNTAEPFPGFDIAAAMLPPSSNPDVRGSTFTFRFDSDSGDYIPLGGTEEFSGSFIFDVDTDKLNLDQQLVLGEFSNSFDQNFQFALTDTVTTNLPIFDVDLLNIIIDANTQMMILELNLDFSEAFSDFLMAAGANQSIAGVRFSQNIETRTFVPLSTQSVPEPSSILGLLMVVLAAGYSKFLCIK